VHVNADGTATMCLGATVPRHVLRGSAADILRMLLDYTATLGREVIVLATQCNGRRTMHQLHPNGTATTLRPLVVSPLPAEPHVRKRRRMSPLRRWPRLVPALRQSRRVLPSAWSASKKWLATYTLRLMLCAEILVLIAALTYMVVTLAPYW
jgi:hypothetical protein